MSNPKAQAFIRELSRVLAKVNSSGIVYESVSTKEHYLLYKLSASINDVFDDLDEIEPVVRVDRLKVFVDYLKRGKFSHKFNLDACTYAHDYPMLFPNEWRKNANEKHMYGIEYIDIDCDFFEGEAFFFGLSELQHKHLFFEYNQNCEWGTVRLNCRSGIKSLIKNIEQFCDYVENLNLKK